MNQLMNQLVKMLETNNRLTIILLKSLETGENKFDKKTLAAMRRQLDLQTKAIKTLKRIDRMVNSKKWTTEDRNLPEDIKELKKELGKP